MRVGRYACVRHVTGTPPPAYPFLLHDDKEQPVRNPRPSRSGGKRRCACTRPPAPCQTPFRLRLTRPSARVEDHFRDDGRYRRHGGTRVNLLRFPGAPAGTTGTINIGFDGARVKPETPADGAEIILWRSTSSGAPASPPPMPRKGCRRPRPGFARSGQRPRRGAPLVRATAGC